MRPLLDGVLADLGIASAGGLELTGDPQPPGLSSPLAVAECALSSVAACLVAAADLAGARTGRRPDVALDTGHVAAAMRSEAWLRDPAGHGMDGFAPLSCLWPAADGWVRTHANYPWHRSALLAALGVAEGAAADVAAALGAAVAERSALDVEHCAYAAGGLAVASRTPHQWRTSAAGESVAAASLIAGEALSVVAVPLAEPGVLPASGVRVLDLTRVIAGPVGTRMLGALGADVLRVDAPHRPELPLHAVDGVIGKASTTLDARTAQGRAVLHALLDQADVLVTGYRPGALRSVGLEPDQVAEQHPGTVVVTLSAWGAVGPWGARRGFDSLVQLASGIGWTLSTDGTMIARQQRSRPKRTECRWATGGAGSRHPAASTASRSPGRTCRRGTPEPSRRSPDPCARCRLAASSHLARAPAPPPGRTRPVPPRARLRGPPDSECRPGRASTAPPARRRRR